LALVALWECGKERPGIALSDSSPVFVFLSAFDCRKTADDGRSR
jgi:hypothetical protein